MDPANDEDPYLTSCLFFRDSRMRRLMQSTRPHLDLSTLGAAHGIAKRYKRRDSVGVWIQLATSRGEAQP